jgi:hypothetical protein
LLQGQVLQHQPHANQQHQRMMQGLFTSVLTPATACYALLAVRQAVLRVLLGLLQRKPLQDMPRMSIPLHTVMHLTPAAAGTASSSPYDLNLIKADLPEDHAPAAATAPATAVVTKELAMAGAVPGAELSAHSRSSSCSSAFVEDGCANHAWPIDPMHSWSSCNSEVQELVVPHAVLAGQHA